MFGFLPVQYVTIGKGVHPSRASIYAARKTNEMKNLLDPLLIWICCCLLTMNINAQKADSIFLYEGAIPNAIPVADWQESFVVNGILRVSSVQYPTMQVYLPPKEKATGTAVVICPGGGYRILAIDHEGYQIAEWLNSLGVAAFVLKYRLPDDRIMKDKATGPLQDAQQAIRLVRQNAKEWGIDANKIGIMGFSAGGHLASTALTHFDQVAGGIKDETSCKPDFGILIYPVISMLNDFGHKGSRNALLGTDPSPQAIAKYSTQLQVTSETAPTFLVSTVDDKGVPPENSMAFFKALKDHGVPTELHIYESGGHGYGMGEGKGSVASWTKRCEEWLLNRKLLNMR